MKGNEALAEAAFRAGMQAYFGYPITPQSEVLEYLALHSPEHPGTVVLQAESEIAAINMVYGAAGAGARTMITSSGPGISLMQEGLSYMACAQLPALVVNIQRGGPGLGTIQPSQGDYQQAVKGGGHGDYRLIVLAPSSVQEMVDHITSSVDSGTGQGHLIPRLQTFEHFQPAIAAQPELEPLAPDTAAIELPDPGRPAFLGCPRPGDGQDPRRRGVRG